MKDMVVGAICPLRCFAGLPRNLAPLWDEGEDGVAAVFYPRALGLVAFSELIYIPYAG